MHFYTFYLGLDTGLVNVNIELMREKNWRVIPLVIYIYIFMHRLSLFNDPTTWGRWFQCLVIFEMALEKHAIF